MFQAAGYGGALRLCPSAWELLFLMAQPTWEGESLSSEDENVLYPIGGFSMNIRPLHAGWL
jgi:hypothetical protein